MAIRRICQAGTLIAVCAVAACAQAPGTEAARCPPPTQEQAAASPAPAVQPTPHENGAAVLPVAQDQHLSPGKKFKVFARYTYSPYTFAGAAFNAGTSQATGGWHSYGGGMEGYGKRYGAALADTESGGFFGGFLFPVLLHEDPRYWRSTSHKALPRIGYALSRVLVAHDDDGNKTANFSLFLSALASSGLANAYYPREERGFGDTMARTGNGMLSTAETNLLREFWPDITRKFRKHEPKSLRKLEDRPTVQKIEQMVLGPVAPPCPTPTAKADQGPDR
jgi:hypothetical protein